MPTEIMPRPDLRERWEPEDSPVRHRHRRPRNWIIAEITGRPRLLAAILALGAFAFVGGGLFHPPAPVAGPPVVGRHPTAGPSTSGPVAPVATDPVGTAAPSTGASVTPSHAAPTPAATRPRATAATRQPSPAPSRTHAASPRPTRAHTSTPPPATSTPRAPSTQKVPMP